MKLGLTESCKQNIVSVSGVSVSWVRQDEGSLTVSIIIIGENGETEGFTTTKILMNQVYRSWVYWYDWLTDFN